MTAKLERITMERLLYPIPEAARMLSLSVHTLRAWISQQRIAYTKLGRRVFFTPEQISRIIESSAREPRERRDS